jgi:hypothetical protein
MNLSISGPASLTPGQSVQFSATLHFSDGSTKTATSDPNLRWRSSNTAVLQVSSAGLVTATDVRGEAILRADWTQPSRTGSKEIVVLPDGTFRLVGGITEQEIPTAVIAGARVEAFPGGAVATTTAGGQYRLYGVPADATIRVTADGYVPAERRVQLTSHAVQNIDLTLSGSRLVLAGRYTLTVDVSGACGGQRPLPADLQHRVYEALVAQTGGSVTVTLTEPRFKLNASGQGNRFTGWASASGVTFNLQPYSSYYYYTGASYPSVAERLADGTHFVPAGAVVATGSPMILSGPLVNAYLSQWNSTFPGGSLLADCSAPAQLTLTRR